MLFAVAFAIWRNSLCWRKYFGISSKKEKNYFGSETGPFTSSHGWSNNNGPTVSEVLLTRTFSSIAALATSIRGSGALWPLFVWRTEGPFKLFFKIFFFFFFYNPFKLYWGHWQPSAFALLFFHFWVPWSVCICTSIYTSYTQVSLH